MSCVSPLSPIPSISVQLVPSTEPLGLEHILDTNDMEDGPRPRHLLPPPVYHPLRFGGPSKELPADKKGMVKGKIDDLVRLSRERTNMMSAKKSVDLRKEVAIKVHHAKQEQRRATFLAKIRALPSPTAVSTPVTPPDSPAEFHFSLPSPGLVSPLALFETLNDLDAYDEEGHIQHAAWIERIDYSRAKPELIPMSPEIRIIQPDPNSLERHHQLAGLLSVNKPLPRLPPCTPSFSIPSLDQITARIAAKSSPKTGIIHPPSSLRPSARAGLPPFLASRQRQGAGLAQAGSPQPRPPFPALTLTRASSASPGRVAKRNEMIEKLNRRISAPARLIPERDPHPITRMPGGF